MENIKFFFYFKKNLKIIKIFFLIIFSSFLFLSFRQLIFFSENQFIYTLIFIIFQTITIFALFKKKVLIINFFIIIILNLILTPIFFHYTFDVPYRSPNTVKSLVYGKDFRNGHFQGTHTISTDQKGNRASGKINYEKKSKDTLRIFAIGASTTEQMGMSDELIWSNKLIEHLKNKKKESFKNYESINFAVGGLRAIHSYFTLIRNLNSDPDLVIFLLGVNDWNHHIVNKNLNYILPDYEINYNFKNSFIHKFFFQFTKVIKKKFNYNEKIIVKNKINKFKGNNYEVFIKKQIYKKKNVEKIINFRPKTVSYEYNFWMTKIMKVCKKEKINCLFADQPSLYKEENKLYRSVFWVNPPFKNYSLNFDDHVILARKYNDYLKDVVNSNDQIFCELSNNITPSEKYFFDDFHFTPSGSTIVGNYMYKCIEKIIK